MKIDVASRGYIYERIAVGGSELWIRLTENTAHLKLKLSKLVLRYNASSFPGAVTRCLNSIGTRKLRCLRVPSKLRLNPSSKVGARGTMKASDVSSLWNSTF